MPDFGAGEESTGTTSGSESGTATESESTGETESTSDTDSGSTTSGAGECPEQLPGGEEACAGKMACKYGEQCCLCDPDMGCDTWTCQPPFAGVFCPDEYPGVGAPCPMEAISCSYCVADDPALICLGGEWSPMLWCF